ncbi:MAG: hypothetical protein EOP92_21240 [Lysobacteraceae bacterium]|nr:MAG: hypothetical protein EOP92_21240 [Xanthomonadaceae bacterium]
MRALLPCLLVSWLLPGTGAAAVDARVLRAGDTALRVELVDVVDEQGGEDRARIEVLHRWLRETAAVVQTPSGRFPLRGAYVRVRQVDSGDSSPVPWGQTRRNGDAGVLLFVRRDASLQALRADWTATHELSHLFHPYLGESGRWLAEGLASYLQNTLRARAGLLTPAQAWQGLDAGFQRGQAARAGGRLDQVDHSRASTMRVYWAGAAYWLEADLALRRRGTRLDTVLDAYSRCCLDGTASVAPAQFVAALDRISGGDSLLRLYRAHAAARRFPSLRSAYRELGISRDRGALRFSMQARPRRLRDAIMRPPTEPASGSPTLPYGPSVPGSSSNPSVDVR